MVQDNELKRLQESVKRMSQVQKSQEEVGKKIREEKEYLISVVTHDIQADTRAREGKAELQFVLFIDRHVEAGDAAPVFIVFVQHIVYFSSRV